MKKDRIKIIYEDKNIIVVDKPTNMLTVATTKERENTLYHKTMNYLKQKNKNNKLFIVHRLDKDTSGVILFAKNEKIKNYFQDNWDDVAISRKYMAVCEGIFERDEDTIKSYLIENKNNFISHSTLNKKDGKLAITSYHLLKISGKYNLIDIEIQTGRKNQIRVHMKENNTPIVGDKKYGSKLNPIHRMCLHAYELVVSYNNQEMVFTSKYPECFNLLFPNKK